MTARPYDFTEATFFFFKAIGRRPGGFIAIALSQLVAYTLLAGLILAAFLPLIRLGIQVETKGVEPSVSEALAAVGGMGLAGLLAMVLGIIVALGVQGAWLRLLTRNEVKPGIPLRFGADELRLLGVNLIFIAFWCIAWIFVSVFFALAAVGGAGLVAAGDGSVWSGLGAGLLGFVVFVALAFLAIWLCIKFAAAPAMTINEQRFRLFESFKATRGIVGWMFLSYLVLIVIFIFGGTLMSTMQWIVGFAGLATAGEAIDQLAAADPDSAEQIFAILGDAMSEPGVIAAVVLLVLLQVAFQILADGLWHGIGAYAAVRHSGEDAAVAEDITAPASVGAAPGEG